MRHTCLELQFHVTYYLNFNCKLEQIYCLLNRFLLNDILNQFVRIKKIEINFLKNDFYYWQSRVFMKREKKTSKREQLYLIIHMFFFFNARYNT